MRGWRNPNSITLAYFSGTGGTKAVCDCFEEQLQKRGIVCKKINMATTSPLDIAKADMLILFSPVYAFRLTSLTEKWVKNLPEGKKKAVSIISVSGAGEMSPNTACRLYCKELLKKKGYHFVYEKMIIMPSNFAIQAEPELNLALLSVLPDKVEQIVSDILSGKKNITVPRFSDRCFAVLGKGEHIGARFFGRSIKASKSCNQCGKCIRHCPKKNITMVNGLPKFGFHCMLCMKCIYSCPRKALKPRILKFAILKDGFDLKSMTKRAREENIRINDQQDGGVLWKGIMDYLRVDDNLKK